MRTTILFLAMISLMVTGCSYDQEAKNLMKDEHTQKEIEAAIIDQANQHYGIDVEVDLSTISFAPANSKLIFPLTTDERLQVETEVVGGDPSYHFKAYVSIYDVESDMYYFDPTVEDAINLHELRNFGDYLLDNIFKLKHKDTFDRLKSDDPLLEINWTLKHDFFGHYFEDKEEAELLHQAFFEDYKKGKFNDIKYYDEVFPRYIEKPEKDWRRFEKLIEGSEPCVPSIWLKTEIDTNENEPVDRKLAQLIERVEKDETLPNGTYFLKVKDEDRNQAEETLLICR